MVLEEFLNENFKASEVEKFKKEYKERYTASALSQFLKRDTKNLNWYRWNIVANFIGIQTEELIKVFCNSKEESIYPKKTDSNKI